MLKRSMVGRALHVAVLGLLPGAGSVRAQATEPSMQASRGMSVRTGTDFDIAGAASQRRWGAEW